MTNNIVHKVPCRLSKGMFDNEYAVEIDLTDGQIVSFFADRTLIEMNGSKTTGFISVNVIHEDANTRKVVLPTEAIESGSRWVTVAR